MWLDFFSLKDRFSKKVEKKLIKEFHVDFLVDCFSRNPAQIGVKWVNGPSIEHVADFLKDIVDRADLKRQYSRDFMHGVINKLVEEGAPREGFLVYMDDPATGACNILFVGRTGRCDDIVHWTTRITEIMNEDAVSV